METIGFNQRGTHEKVILRGEQRATNTAYGARKRFSPLVLLVSRYTSNIYTKIKLTVRRRDIPDKIIAPVPSLIAGQAVFPVEPAHGPAAANIEFIIRGEFVRAELRAQPRRPGKCVASRVNFIIACRFAWTIRDSGLYIPAFSSGVGVELSQGRLRWMPMLASTIFLLK